MIKKLFGFIKFLCFLFLMLVAVSLFLPGKYHIERDIIIDATPSEIYQFAATPKTYNDWTAWNTTKYPKMKYTYEGPETGVGAISKWTDPDNGGGQLTIVKADLQTGIETLVQFDMFENPLHGKFVFEEQDGKTKVTWSGEGVNGANPLNRIFGFLMDKMLGPDYETGLEGLKNIVEEKKNKDNPKDDKGLST